MIQDMQNLNIIKILDLNAPELDVYARYSEPMLSHINEPDLGIFIAESPNVIMRAMDAGYEPVSFLMEEKSILGEGLPIITRYPDVPIYTAELDVLVKITGFQLTRGLLCAMKRRVLPTPEEVCKNATRIAVLEGVVNPTNVGAIVRSAAALNIDAILLSPDSCDPLYRRSARVSMGTIFQIPWTYVCKSRSEWDEKGLSIIRKMGFSIIAMALTSGSIPIDDERIGKYEKLAIVLGAEGSGLSEKTIKDSDHSVIIPMSHNVDSLNVAAASAVAFWELGRNKVN